MRLPWPMMQELSHEKASPRPGWRDFCAFLLYKIVEIAVLGADNEFPKFCHCIGEGGSAGGFGVGDHYHGAARRHLDACATIAGASCPPGWTREAHPPICHINHLH
jgi:hypothetical protein